MRSFDDLKATAAAFEPADDTTPEAAYREAWRRDVLQRAFDAVLEKAQQENRLAEYQIFVSYYSGESDVSLTWKALADQYKLHDWKQAKNRADWTSRHLAAAIRAEIRKYVDSDEEIDEELRDLFR